MYEGFAVHIRGLPVCGRDLPVYRGLPVCRRGLPVCSIVYVSV